MAGDGRAFAYCGWRQNHPWRGIFSDVTSSGRRQPDDEREDEERELRRRRRHFAAA